MYIDRCGEKETPLGEKETLLGGKRPYLAKKRPFLLMLSLHRQGTYLKRGGALEALDHRTRSGAYDGSDVASQGVGLGRVWAGAGLVGGPGLGGLGGRACFVQT